MKKVFKLDEDLFLRLMDDEWVIWECFYLWLWYWFLFIEEELIARIIESA